MKTLNIWLIIFLIVAIASCDIVEPPYRKGGSTEPVDTTKRKVLLEDFTGFRCGNCPEAAHLAHEIAELYPGRVIKIALHAGPLAVPTPTRKYDFRTTETNELANFYGLVATPYGMVNRGKYVGQNLLAPTAWGGYVAEALTKDADLKIGLTASYNESNREILLDAKLDYIRQGNVNHFIAVYIIEDSVVKYQQDDRQFPNIHVLDFVHDNVMRGSFNGTWGVAVSDTPLNANSSITIPYKYQIPAEKDWRPEKLSLIVFVHSNDTKEILQVEKVSLFDK